MAEAHHRLVLVDKGVAYKHRWVPTCPCCGWVGIAALKPRARRQYRQHREAGTSAARRPEGRTVRRACTPRADLPALLR